jgi:hypothetical protein
LEILTWVPEFNSVISRVVPGGTAIFESTVVAQEVLDLLAEAASVKLHVARFARSGAAVGAGPAAGAAETTVVPARRSPRTAE